jgi:hypothetical protein
MADAGIGVLVGQPFSDADEAGRDLIIDDLALRC